MSLCLVTETQDCVWIGADSATSYNVNGKCLRGWNEEVEKVFCHANTVFFLCGSVHNAVNTRRYIESLTVITPNALSDIAAQMRVITKEGRSYTDKNVKTAIIGVMLDSGRVFGINENNDFVVETPINPNLRGFKTICCVGVDNDYAARGHGLAEKHRNIQSIPEIFSRVYSELSCNGIGGHVDLYQLNVKTQAIKKYHVSITEHDIEYIIAHATMTNGSINWGNVNSDPVATNAANTANNALTAANNANSNATAASDLARRIANGTFSGGTFINGREIYSPTIRANNFVVQPSDISSRTGGYNIYGYFGSQLFNMFKLSYFAGDGAYINFDSPAGAHAYWNFAVSHFGKTGSKMFYYGDMDFSRANVIGMYATFA
jgi:hypothetical protein